MIHFKNKVIYKHRIQLMNKIANKEMNGKNLVKMIDKQIK